MLLNLDMYCQAYFARRMADYEIQDPLSDKGADGSLVRAS